MNRKIGVQSKECTRPKGRGPRKSELQAGGWKENGSPSPIIVPYDTHEREGKASKNSQNTQIFMNLD